MNITTQMWRMDSFFINLVNKTVNLINTALKLSNNVARSSIWKLSYLRWMISFINFKHERGDEIRLGWRWYLSLLTVLTFTRFPLQFNSNKKKCSRSQDRPVLSRSRPLAVEPYTRASGRGDVNTSRPKSTASSLVNGDKNTWVFLTRKAQVFIGDQVSVKWFIQVFTDMSST